MPGCRTRKRAAKRAKSNSRLCLAKRRAILCACTCAKWALCRLLTRESEVVIAKRLERGNLRVLKTVSRSAIVVKELDRHGS